ncbi:hypothetical protein GJ496_007883 [Pomphorhynchus laevis]|nr:hypothetical protein GJ496_007883 [Pomphorhynchus laevis]
MNASTRRRTLARRLKLWNEKQYNKLYNEVHNLQMSIQFSKPRQSSWKQQFIQSMKNGRTTQSMRILDKCDTIGGVLPLESQIGNKTVKEILIEKHPKELMPHQCALLDINHTTSHEYILFRLDRLNGSTIIETASQLSIQNRLLPKLIRLDNIDDDLREVIEISTQMGGLDIANPCRQIRRQYERFLTLCEPFQEHINDIPAIRSAQSAIIDNIRAQKSETFIQLRMGMPRKYVECLNHAISFV